MDALLSIPVLGYFLMPSLTTYSTSLNLLFFYMTWSTLVLTQPPLRVEIVGTLGIRFLFFLVPSTLFLIFDSILPSLAIGMKKQGSAALPTRAGGAQVSRRGATRPRWYKVIGLSVFNIFLGLVIQAGVELLFTQVFHIRSALRVTTTLPMPWSICKDLMRALVLREVLQYYIHRFILHPSSPNFISKLHNNCFHSITAPYSFCTHYDNPLSYLFFRFIPSYLPAIILRTHLLTYLLLLSIITFEETITLSGYNTVPGIILGGIARRQDLHSAGHGKGNFAPWGFLDWVHGTSIGPDLIDDARDEAEKQQVKERSGNAWAEAKETGKALNMRRKSGRKN